MSGQRLPSKDDILKFIRESPAQVGKREIARAFRVKGSDRIELKQMLSELAEEGLIGRDGRKRFSEPGSLPPVGVIEIVGHDDEGELLAAPQVWDGEGTRPIIILAPQGKSEPGVSIGDRALAKLRKLGSDELPDYEARIIKRLPAQQRSLGVFRARDNGGRVEPVNKKANREFEIPRGDENGAVDGELVEIETLRGPRFGLPRARVVARLGDLGAPRSISLIAIHEHDIPVDFPEQAIAEAERAEALTNLKGREDLRDIPFVTIDPADARDHDDAVFAEADPDNEGGHILWIAIADVAHYVRPGSALDHEARKRGNSCYFPDRVVPMLPDALSGDLCSLHEGVDRPCLGVRIVLSKDGSKRDHAFFRGVMRSAASLSYEDAQAAHQGGDHPLKDRVIAPLFAAYAALEAARERRQPLHLDLPERRIAISAEGRVASIGFRARFDAHKLIEECMVLANVCAAQTLESKRQELVYRVHEPPLEERIEALRESLQTLGISLAKGERLTPAHLNRALDQAAKTAASETVSLSVLRAQTQAYYSPVNLGHFGLNLARYAHFTSPIRRYADLIVHRALITALGLGADPKHDGLGAQGVATLDADAKAISQTERRAMLAERDSADRYVAAYMEDRVGGEFEGLVSGVARFGLFVKLDETGADGLVPVSSLGDDYYRHDPEASTLTGERTGRRFALGQRVTVRLEEAVPVTGGLLFTLLDGGEAGKGQVRRKPPRGAHKAKRLAAAKRRAATRKPR